MRTEHTGKISDFFDSTNEAEQAIMDAEAEAVTAWELQFIDGIRRRWDAYGTEMFMSEAQYNNLVKITGA